MRIKAVVFDFGGVISFPPSPEAYAKLERLTGLSTETLRELNGKYRGEWDRGTCDGMGYYRRLLSGVDIFPDDNSLAEIVRADMDGWKRINHDALALMREVKSSPLALGILSNMPRDFLSWVNENVSECAEADTAVFSCDYNVIKPETEIYEILRKKLGCAYNEIVFFDDTGENIIKARELGIRGILWEGADAARKILIGMEPGFIAND